jgi:V/A-type H+/Na+-transporting ATPase subunit D
MKVNIAATKTNLIKAKKSYALTQEGYELLDEKRKILMAELSNIVHVADKAQRDADNALKEAYAVMDKAIVSLGRKKVEEISFSVDIHSDLTISQRQIMGVSIPVINARITENPPYYSPVGLNVYVDESIARFKEILTLLSKLAESKIALLRIAREIQKTIRKVNALEKIHLPYYREAVKYISDRLDEETRESFSMLKLIKQRLKA